MLPKENRIITPEDYKLVFRKGKRHTMDHFRVSVLPVKGVTRVGVTVNNKVGKAHDRNWVKRQAREVAAEFIARVPEGYMVGVYALPGAAQVDRELVWSELMAVLNRYN